MKSAILAIGAASVSTVLVVAATAASTGAPISRAGTSRVAVAAPAMNMGMGSMAAMPMAAGDAMSRAMPASAAVARINMVIVPDALMGSNKRTHDAYVPAYISAKAGQQVVVTVYNLDTAPHSFTASALGLNVIVPGASGQGGVGTKTFSFTVGKAGTYHWKCILPCDNGGANAWAMTHDGYMAGTITIQR